MAITDRALPTRAQLRDAAPILYAACLQIVRENQTTHALPMWADHLLRDAIIAAGGPRRLEAES